MVEQEFHPERTDEKSLHRLPSIVSKICSDEPIKLVSIAPNRILELVSYGPKCAQITDWNGGGYEQKIFLKEVEFQGENFLCVHLTINIPGVEPYTTMVAINQHHDESMYNFAPQGDESFVAESAYLRTIEDRLLKEKVKDNLFDNNIFT